MHIWQNSANTAPAAYLRCQGLRVKAGPHLVCSDFTWSLQAGQMVAILGRNGAGKSTLLSVLGGLQPAEAGEVLLGERDYRQLSPKEAARERGFLAQSSSDPFATTVLETALAGRHPHLTRWAWESPDDERIAREALQAVGLQGMEQRQAPSLSGGERQRLGIATLLAQRPRLFLLDEPLAHLDLNHQIAVLELFRERCAREGAACVLVLHEPGLAARYCQRVLLVRGDGMVEQGESVDLLNAAQLSALYGHPLRELADEGGRWFVPC